MIKREMMEEINKILFENIKEAELVLVGIGEEFEEDIPEMKEDLVFSQALHKIEEKKELMWMMPYVKRVYEDLHRTDKTEKAYKALEDLLEGKNYFIVSTRTDDYIYQTGLVKEKTVTPCGGYGFSHCVDGCQKKLYESDRKTMENIYDCFTKGINLDSVRRPLCPDCGKDLVFNSIEYAGYLEEGYLAQWDKYKKWLQGTVNKKLCILELGVGMRFPTVIRWPFEKVVFFNQKANIFRIHSKLYQLTEEIKDRGYKIEKKPMDFLINGFV